MRNVFTGQRKRFAFTLVELLVVIAIVVVLSSLVLPALAGAKSRSLAVACQNNQRQLEFATILYAGDFKDFLPYNLGASEIKQAARSGRFPNWTTPVMSWELDADNTNTFSLTRGGIGPYTSRSAQIYRCPSDFVVSDVQKTAGWNQRVRSISMNAMVGNAGEFSRTGANVNNPDYRQFFRVTDVPLPSQIFVFIEEHPDSINDGYFLNKPDTQMWYDLPASYHNAAANLTFADGHAELHTWRSSTTSPPSRPDSAHLPFPIPNTEKSDFQWLMDRTTVENVVNPWGN